MDENAKAPQAYDTTDERQTAAEAHGDMEKAHSHHQELVSHCQDLELRQSYLLKQLEVAHSGHQSKAQESQATSHQVQLLASQLSALSLRLEASETTKQTMENDLRQRFQIQMDEFRASTSEQYQLLLQLTLEL